MGYSKNRIDNWTHAAWLKAGLCRRIKNDKIDVGVKVIRSSFLQT